MSPSGLLMSSIRQTGLGKNSMQPPCLTVTITNYVYLANCMRLQNR
uniref:Uncharacterized protein n=1 Tax=Anguilla anguilla TaxID=7936 RepID=A0A0E9QNM9_ANGAN